MLFTPFFNYLTSIKPTIHTYSEIQQQVLQGFYYGVCAMFFNDDVLGDVDHILRYAGESYVKQYRNVCQPFHVMFSHLAATVGGLDQMTDIASYVDGCESFFRDHISPPYNTLFTRLADGEVVEVEAPAATPKKRSVAALSAVRKTVRRRRSREHSPPPIAEFSGHSG
jgi:hypothetical protein